MKQVFTTQLAGRTLTAEIGALAGQAGGSVLMRCGDTAVLVCATMSAFPRGEIDWFPLSVDFEEKLYAVGKIPGGFIKREGRPSEKAILTSRLIDRPIRPLFPKGIFNDVHVVATALSAENDIPPDMCAMIGSSIALCVSDIPFDGPTAAVVVGLVDGEYIINPDAAQREASTLHVVVAGTADAVLMVEAGAKEVSDDDMLNAILFGFEEVKKLVAWQNEILKSVSKPKRVFAPKPDQSELKAAVAQAASERLDWALSTFDRNERQARQDQVSAETKAALAETFPDSGKLIDGILYDMTKQKVRRKILDHGVRPDGRGLEDVRPIWCETGFLARTHGSGLFTRGETQVLSAVTLGSMAEVQRINGLTDEESKRYIHHYNFPPYTTGETKPMRGPGRREIGHGALAERALEPVIPSEVDFPYAIRVVSEVISSNGSTSQGSVCASTLSLMDAGVPILRPVAGVAMGLIQDEETGDIRILTDIQGLEDFLGDMDFKVAGTERGITAIQMDMKVHGICREILQNAISQANRGRAHILEKMLQTLPAPREELSPYAPKIISFSIHPDKIREVIGSGGKVINKIIADTGVKIDIDDDGTVYIVTSDAEAAARAKSIIMGIARDVQVGDIYYGRVVRLLPNVGAFVELTPGKDGLVHISRLGDGSTRVEKVEDVVKVEDMLYVRVFEVDRQGRYNLATRGVTQEQYEEFQATL